MISTISEVRCIGCNQVLTDRLSIERGYGDRCRTKLNKAAREVSTRYSHDQVRKAATALRDGKVRFYGGCPESPLWRVESGTTNEIYFTTVHTCTCPATGRCYHRCAAMIRDLVPLHRH